ncbi:MAG: hypothetical protein IJA82_06770 [Clostridia bacterium]|nr:hypothetical protein [Clostridia bacterium]
MNFDPVELTKEYLAIKDELEALVLKKVGKRRGLGYCHLYWATKKRILKEKYGIDWKSPAELNPGVLFD